MSNQTTDATAAATSSETSDFHRLRSNAQRRTVIELLQDRSQDITVTELAKQVTTLHAPQAPVRDVVIRLHHVHFPMLSDAGLIEYDSEAKSVSPIDATSDLLTAT
jgi:hypothetical protein